MSYFPTPSTDITAAPASGAVSDVHAVPALDGAGVFVRVTLAQVLAWMQGHWPDLPALATPVILAANTILDASVHQRRLLVATTALTISTPTSLGNLGTSFDCTVVNDGAGVVTFGSGITSLSASIAPGQVARIVGYNNGAGIVVRALVSAGAPSTAPGISLTGPGGAQFVAPGGTTASVPLTLALANYSAAPTLNISIDGGAYTALPNGTVTSAGVTGLTVALAGGVHSIVIKDTSTNLASNTLTSTVESDTLTGVPASGWVAGTAKALTGATTTLAGLSTAYAVLWSGTAEVGARQAFTNSATLAALSFTPATSNATHTVRVYDAPSVGNLLAETAAFTVAATAGALTQIAPPVGGVAISANGLYKLVTLTEGFASAGSTIPRVNANYNLLLVRANPTGVDRSYDGARDSGATYNGLTFPKGSYAHDGYTDATHGGITGLTVGFNPTATGTATQALYNTNAYSEYFSEGNRGVFPGGTPWFTTSGMPGQYANPAPATGSTMYGVVTTSDGQTMYIGPMTIG